VLLRRGRGGRLLSPTLSACLHSWPHSRGVTLSLTS
jgi:hypothetical protein